jgi:hypothetical protein
MDVQTISVAIAAIGLFIAAINQIYSNRQANQQRQAELFMQMYDRWSSKDFRRDSWELMGRGLNAEELRRFS